MKTYDPNACHLFPSHSVRLTFQQWAYRTTTVVQVGGNCMGMSVIETALQVAYDKLPENDYAEKFITMKKPKADLTCADEDGGETDWLGKMLVKAEIIAVEPNAKKRPATSDSEQPK